MTLEETIRGYIYTAVDNYLEEHLEHILRQRNNNQSYVSEYITEELLDKYLNEHDYMTRDDVNDQISGATVFIEASLSA